MTKSTITREQLEEWVAQFDEDGGCDATDRQLEALIRQSLAAMDSEPVAWRRFQETPNDVGYWILYDYRPNCSGVEPLYRHAQPAQVVQCVPLGDSPYDVPHSMPSNLRELIAEEIGILFSDDDAQSVWDVCRRAAMLAAAPQEVNHG